MDDVMERVTVIINNRDLLDFPKRMCDEISRMENLHEIIFLDNGSTNRDLLQWYKNCKYKVFFIENLGPTAPWDCGLIEHLPTDLYVVANSALDLTEAPNNTLTNLSEILRNNPSEEKVGLQLSTTNISNKSSHFIQANKYKEKIECAQKFGNFLKVVPFDVAFTLYDRRIGRTNKFCGVTAIAPFVATYLPWGEAKYENEFVNNADDLNYEMLNSNKEEILSQSELRNLYSNHKEGKVSSKWSSYFPVYDKWFYSYRNRPIKLLEIGVQNGGSLEMWSQYFDSAELVIGCDVNPAIANLIYDDSRIKTVVGVASEKSTFDKIHAHANDGFDIIIDDGSHRSLDTIVNFLTFFPLLKPGGLFVVEDMHCAYWPEYEGGFFNQRSAASFFKGIFDLVNIEHCRNDFNPQQLFQTFFTNKKIPDMLADGSIFGITAYNSLYLIEKSSSVCKPILGDIVIAGNDASIEPRAVPNKAK